MMLPPVALEVTWRDKLTIILINIKVKVNINISINIKVNMNDNISISININIKVNIISLTSALSSSSPPFGQWWKLWRLNYQPLAESSTVG